MHRALGPRRHDLTTLTTAHTQEDRRCSSDARDGGVRQSDKQERQRQPAAMPSAAPATDVRVRTPVSLPARPEQLDAEPSKQPTRSPTAAAASAPRPSRPPSSATSRPALSRNAASHASIGSGGTDSTTYLQSDDGSGGVPEFGDTIDSTTFEQVCGAAPRRTRWVGREGAG